MYDLTRIPANRQRMVQQRAAQIQPASVTDLVPVPTLIESAGSNARRSFVEFFAATIENDNTRAAYAEAVDRFLHWCLDRKLTLETIEPTLVAATGRLQVVEPARCRLCLTKQ